MIVFIVLFKVSAQIVNLAS